jgi:hypothetical protein
MVQLDKAAIEESIAAYCDAWGEPDPARRREMLERIWAEGATYSDPTVQTRGIDELLAHMANLQITYPGGRIERTSAVDTHHGTARFGWRMALADGATLSEGIDFAEIGADGKLRSIVGFFGALRPRRTG